MNKELQKFQDYFSEYQKQFGLTGYKVYFKHEPLENNFAEIRFSDGYQVATVALNSKLPKKDKPFKHTKLSAKHEAIHLLLYRLENNAKWRYSNEAEISEAVEELVFKLEGLIGD